MVQSKAAAIEAALVRIQHDYLEMPDLELTLDEAVRLWNIEPVRCLALLEFLAIEGFLTHSRRGGYKRGWDEVPTRQRAATTTTLN